MLVIRTNDEPIVQTLRRLIPADAAVAVWDGLDEAPSWPEELEYVRAAVPKRRLEFQRGRACARHTLSLLGVPPGPIPVGLHRAPVWPWGFVGSITHCDGLVAAVAAPMRTILTIGLDVEPARPLPVEVRAIVLHPSEVSPCGDALLDTVVFSAKETVHKALFPLAGVWMDFLDVVIRLDPPRGRFTAEAAPNACATTSWLPYLRGTFDVAHGFVLTVSHVARQPLLRTPA